MGWFSGLGNFLGGYAQARRQKQLDKSAEHQQMMNEAQQWASVADRASGPGGDAVREMATKNMQDIIIKYEKSAGEKNGIGSIVKMFGGDKKDSPAMLNKLAPMLSQRVEPMGSSQGTEVNNTEATEGTGNVGSMAGLGQAQEQARQVEPQQSAPRYDQATYEQAAQQGMPLQPEDSQQPTFNTVSDQAQKAAVAPAASGINAPADQYAGNKGASDRFMAMAKTVAPNRSVFTPQYSGGTRYSPTYQEMEASRLEAQKKEMELKSEQELHNAEKISDLQEKKRQESINKEVTTAQNSSVWPTLSKVQQDRWIASIQTKTPVPQFTQQDLEVVGEPFIKNGKIYAKNRMGEEMLHESDWKKQNPVAGTILDLQPSDKKDLDSALREAGEYEKSKRNVELELQRAQATRYKEMTKSEKDQTTRENRLMLTTSQGQAQRELSKVEDDWNNHIKVIGNGLKFGATVDEMITGRDSSGQPSKKYPGGMKRPDGSAFSSLEDYENYWKSKQLPEGISIDRYRVFMVTGIDPLGKISGSYQTEEERNKALGRTDSVSAPADSTPAASSPTAAPTTSAYEPPASLVKALTPPPATSPVLGSMARGHARANDGMRTPGYPHRPTPPWEPKEKTPKSDTKKHGAEEKREAAPAAAKQETSEEKKERIARKARI
jgi:hypothetical protein